MKIFVKDKYLEIAKNTGVFNPPEIEVFKELLDEYADYLEEDYFLYEEKHKDEIIGFIFFARTVITEFSWDIYWLMVAKEWQGKGVGKKLLQAVEGHILQNQHRAIVRIETSTKKEYAHARNLYQCCGYHKAGIVPNFYAEGDDLVTFYKEIVRPSAR